MAAKTTAELLSELQAEFSLLKTQVAVVSDQLGRADVLNVRERLAVLESQFSELRRVKDEADRRYYQFVLLFFGGLVTLAVNFALTFIRK